MSQVDGAGVVRAAGGVLWRPADSGGIEVAVVHRPRYDDWSLPKGKLNRGEPALLGALREVGEETGFQAVAGRTLGSSTYCVLLQGREAPKTVRWWAMTATGGAFQPGPEVDALEWLGPADAQRRLSAGRDVAPLRLLAEQGTDTTTVLLVRHGRAGSRATWPGEDVDRPLDAKGEAQAAALADLLPAYAPCRVLSAPVQRCLDTVAPLAGRLRLPVEMDPAIGEQAFGADPDAAVRAVLAVVAGSVPAVVCSQGGAVPHVVSALAASAGLAVGDVRTRKGSLWALSFLGGRLVDADHHPPLA